MTDWDDPIKESITPNVWVPSKKSRDYSPLEKFGRVCFLSEGSMHPLAFRKTYYRFIEVMETTTPEDFVVLSSLNMLSGLACAILARRYGFLNVLIWDESNGIYIPRHLNLDEKLNVIEVFHPNEDHHARALTTPSDEPDE